MDSKKQEALDALLNNSFSHLTVEVGERVNPLLRKETIRILMDKGVLKPRFHPADNEWGYVVSLWVLRYADRDVQGTAFDLIGHLDHLVYLSELK